MSDRPCRECHKSGWLTCTRCKGRGEARARAPGANHLEQRTGLCGQCGGSGAVMCRGCGGVGVKPPKAVLA